MKLELKHLAPYLPYALKIQGITHGEIAELSCCTETSVNITTRSFQYGMWADIFDIKPILRPLSDLVKMNKSLYESYLMSGCEIDRMPYLSILACLENHYDIFGLIDAGLAININTL
tara:strand:- start:1616 stop:1966 length:351 start_codon:yes stop_codon:yes gene_type:complete